ncbi:SOCS7 [Branchiostoma lanceolatum]|uniref:Suppressor of cytokine signaling 7 n=1 Tax=Branchiostoma lanceolatum TaxID=7740 RepID=A0A8K0EG19_BRALA|nr:SOCS7 [Branchiostoma lanceolatum]
MAESANIKLVDRVKRKLRFTNRRKDHNIPQLDTDSAKTYVARYRNTSSNSHIEETPVQNGADTTAILTPPAKSESVFMAPPIKEAAKGMATLNIGEFKDVSSTNTRSIPSPHLNGKVKQRGIVDLPSGEKANEIALIGLAQTKTVPYEHPRLSRKDAIPSTLLHADAQTSLVEGQDRKNHVCNGNGVLADANMKPDRMNAAQEVPISGQKDGVQQASCPPCEENMSGTNQGKVLANGDMRGLPAPALGRNARERRLSAETTCHHNGQKPPEVGGRKTSITDVTQSKVDDRSANAALRVKTEPLKDASKASATETPFTRGNRKDSLSDMESISSEADTSSAKEAEIHQDSEIVREEQLQVKQPVSPCMPVLVDEGYRSDCSPTMTAKQCSEIKDIESNPSANVACACGSPENRTQGQSQASNGRKCPNPPSEELTSAAMTENSKEASCTPSKTCDSADSNCQSKCEAVPPCVNNGTAAHPACAGATIEPKIDLGARPKERKQGESESTKLSPSFKQRSASDGHVCKSRRYNDDGSPPPLPPRDPSLFQKLLNSRGPAVTDGEDEEEFPTHEFLPEVDDFDDPIFLSIVERETMERDLLTNAVRHRRSLEFVNERGQIVRDGLVLVQPPGLSESDYFSTDEVNGAGANVQESPPSPNTLMPPSFPVGPRQAGNRRAGDYHDVVLPAARNNRPTSLYQNTGSNYAQTGNYAAKKPESPGPKSPKSPKFLREDSKNQEANLKKRMSVWLETCKKNLDPRKRHSASDLKLANRPLPDLPPVEAMKPPPNPTVLPGLRENPPEVDPLPENSVFLRNRPKYGRAASTTSEKEDSMPAVEGSPREFAKSLKELERCGWYWGPMNWDDAETKLAGKPDGSFLVRDSSDDRYILSLSFRARGGTHHTRIEHSKGVFSFWSQPKSHGCSPSIVEFIETAMLHSNTGKFQYYLRARALGSPPVPVLLLKPISRFENLKSLQHICRFIIRKQVRIDHIDLLPLPKGLKQYLTDCQYYDIDEETFFDERKRKDEQKNGDEDDEDDDDDDDEREGLY